MRPTRGMLLAIVLCGALVALMTASGCSTTHTAALDQARASYQTAAANPDVQTNSAGTLYEANESLNRAENAKNDKDQEYYAYLSQRESERAIDEANQKKAEKEMTQAAKERDQILLQSREQQAAVATQEAQAETQRAEAAREQAAEAKGEARMAQEQAAESNAQEQMAQTQTQQLETQFRDMNATATSRGVVMTLGDLMFEPEQSALTSGAMEQVNRLAGVLQQNPNERVTIEGYTDNQGDSLRNQQLSEDRANAVRDALIARGVSPDRIRSTGFGGRFPVAGNDTPEGRLQNRRVEIVVAPA